MSTYLAIGSVCWDEVPLPDRVDRRLGGSVLFAARVARAAGWEPHIVTSGTEELEAAVREALPGIDLTVLRSRADTVMAFGEQTELGPQAVPTVADPIDLAAAAVDPAAADLVHLAPIMGEVTATLVDQLGAARFVGLTPQGMLRCLEPGTNRLGLEHDPRPWWGDAVDAVVVSESEHARFAEGLSLPDAAVAVTRGERGCIGQRGGEHVDLPGVEVEESEAGTIGAGDVFAASLFMALASGTGFRNAMDHANRTAARHVAGDLAV